MRLSNREQGSMLPLFGGLAFVSFVMIALVVELALLGSTYRSVAAAADAASEAGASMLSEAEAYESRLVVDGDRARQVSSEVARRLAGADVVVDVAPTPSRVCVTVGQAYEPTTLGLLGVGAIDVSVTSCAEPRVG